MSFRHIPARVIIRLRSEDSVTNFKMTLDDTSVLEFFQTGPGAGVFGFNQRWSLRIYISEPFHAMVEREWDLDTPQIRPFIIYSRFDADSNKVMTLTFLSLQSVDKFDKSATFLSFLLFSLYRYLGTLQYAII